MLTFRIMTTADIDLGMRLKRQEGWNQTAADWQRFIALSPKGCFVAAEDGRDVATVTTARFGPVAWIAMVLVDETMRGRGVGKAVLQHAIAHLDGQGVQSIRLDATPMGRPLYEKLGFVAQFDMERYAGQPVIDAPLNGVRPMSVCDIDAILALDAAVMATPRAELIRRLVAEHPANVRLGNGGYMTSRPGESATFIGPCIAQTHAGMALLKEALSRHRGRRVYIDVPCDNLAAVAIVKSAGLQPQRTLTRMTRGPMVVEDVRRIWATTGPEKG